MKKTRENGFVLILVVAMIAFIGAEMFVLTAASRVIAYQANRTYLDACERNLTASAIVWAKHNPKSKSAEEPSDTVELDTQGLNISNAGLSVTVNKTEDGDIRVEIDSS